jgi:ATP-dependent Clp protease adaptor protein ClpS
MPFHRPAAGPIPRATTETDTEADVERMQRVLAQLLPPYKVLLHNDDYNSMGHVVQALRRVVPSLSRTDALRIMLEAHTTGVALVIICPKELAEHYRDGLRSFRLTSTIEPDC